MHSAFSHDLAQRFPRVITLERSISGQHIIPVVCHMTINQKYLLALVDHGVKDTLPVDQDFLFSESSTFSSFQIIDEKILCVHGGLSPDVKTIDQIRMIERAQEIPHKGAFCDILLNIFIVEIRLAVVFQSK